MEVEEGGWGRGRRGTGEEEGMGEEEEDGGGGGDGGGGWGWGRRMEEEEGMGRRGMGEEGKEECKEGWVREEGVIINCRTVSYLQAMVSFRRDGGWAFSPP